MKECKYKVLFKGGGLLSSHYYTLTEACTAAKIAMANAYLQAEVVLRGSEIVLAKLTRFGKEAKIEFPDLTRVLENTPKHWMEMANWVITNGDGDPVKWEKCLLKAETDVICIRWAQNFCRTALEQIKE